MKSRRWWIMVLAIVVVIGGGGWYWLSASKTDKPLQAAFQTTQVRKGNLEVKISGTGNIEAANRATIKAGSSGTIDEVKVKQGDKVKKGQVLATFEQDQSGNISNQIRGKELDLKKQQLDLADLQTQYKEAQEDDRRAQLAISMQRQQLDIESTKSDIQSLKDNQNAMDPITAPMDGTLATFTLAAGDTVGGQGASGSGLGEVVDYNHLQMVVGVDELDISKVKLNQDANIVVEALPEQKFTGKVAAIAQEGTTSNGVSTFDVTIALDDVNNLKAGMSAEASIMTESKADALYLPIEAVQSFGKQYFVMVPSAAADEGTGSGSETSQAQGQTSNQTGRQRWAQNSQNGQNGQSWQGNNASGNIARQSRQSTALAQSGLKRIAVQVGIHNEDFIEIVYGLKEGDAVAIPTVTGTSGTNRTGAAGLPGFGIGGGGFGGGTGGGFGGGNRQSGGSNRQTDSNSNSNQGGGSRG